MEETNNIAEIISTAGAIGSVIGAYIAWLQFRKAKSSAEAASVIENRLTEVMRQKEMVREVQKIKSLIQKLSRYVRPGQSVKRLGLSLEQDLEELTNFRNDFKSSSKYSISFKDPLDGIFNIVTSVHFEGAEEAERISSIKTIIEHLTDIAVMIDREASSND